MGDLLDVNVWVGLTVATHPARGVAQRYWNEEAAPRIVFCRMSALGLVRVCSGKNTVGGTPLTISQAWEAYRAWRDQEGVVLQSEPEGVEAALEGWIEESRITPKLWSDAYLAAFAVASGLRLVTFDEDFERFPGLDLLRLRF